MGPGFESQRDHEGYYSIGNTPFVSEDTFFIYKQRCKTKFDDSVAQSVEQYTFNVWVLGSNPSGITKKPSNQMIWRLF
jgi:hypothetical protein